MGLLGYKKADLQASINLMNIHLAKLNKAIDGDDENYPEACSAIRAIQDECANASRVAATLSLSAHLHSNQRR